MENEMMREIFRETNWTELTALDVDTAWTNFQKIYDQAVETCIPTSLTNPNSGWRKPLWMTSKALKLTKRKYWAWQRNKNKGSYEDYQRYTHKRNKAQWESVKLRRNFEKLIARETKNKPKSFCRYVKSQTKAKEGICPMEKEDGSITNTDFEKAEVLNSFFSSVFTREDLTNIPHIEAKSFKEPLSPVPISNKEVWDLLRKIKPEKSPGPILYTPEYCKNVQKS